MAGGGEPLKVQKRQIWLDCDPGHDDAMAIILAAHTDTVELLGISTVAGNQEVTKVTENAHKVLQMCGREDIDVVMGQAKPLLRPARLCPEIHGVSGLDGPLLPPHAPPRPPPPGPAAVAMYAAIRAAAAASKRLGKTGEGEGEEDGALKEGEPPIALVCTGALTNAALLLILFPEIVADIEIVLMGGCLGVGNTGPVMEFNIQCDPEAAKVVFESGVRLTMIPLEVTHTAIVTPEVLALIRTPTPSPFRLLVEGLLLFFAETYREVFKFEHPPLHDPCAVAFVIAPHIFKGERLRVDIEAKSELSAGQTICDVWHHSGLPPNAFVTTKMDTSAFWMLMYKAFQNADGASPCNKAGES